MPKFFHALLTEVMFKNMIMLFVIWSYCRESK